MSPEDEEARLLLRKAREDGTAVTRFATDPALSDAVIGFHAQQAVEKALKAVVASYGLEVPRSHDVRFLLELLDGLDVAVPDTVRAGEAMAPWAVEFRYGNVLDDALDRELAAKLVSDVIAWAARTLSARPT